MVNSISCVLVWACTSPFFQVAVVAAGKWHLSAFTVGRMFGGSVVWACTATARTVKAAARESARRTIRLREARAGQGGVSILTLYNPRSDEEAGRFSGVRGGQRHAARCRRAIARVTAEAAVPGGHVVLAKRRRSAALYRIFRRTHVENGHRIRRLDDGDSAAGARLRWSYRDADRPRHIGQADRRHRW